MGTLFFIAERFYLPFEKKTAADLLLVSAASLLLF